MAKRAQAEIARALQRLPQTERASQLVVPSSHATGTELKVVKAALDNPPAKADAVVTLIAFLSAATVIAKSISDGPAKPWNLVLMLLAAGGAFLVVSKYIEAKKAKQPLQDQAKEYVDSLLALQNPVEAPGVKTRIAEPSEALKPSPAESANASLDESAETHEQEPEVKKETT